MAKTPVRRLIEKGIEAGAGYIPDALEVPLRRVFNMDAPSMAVKPKAKPKSSPPKVETPSTKPRAVIRPDDKFRGKGTPHITDTDPKKTFVVRSTTQSQIDDMVASGLVRPKEGGYGKQQSPQIYFGESDVALPTDVFGKPRPGKFVLVGKSENLAGKEGPISLDNLEHIWEDVDGEIVDILPDVLRKNQEFVPTRASPLDMGTEARMARAREMGFDVDNPLYVSTLGDVAAFNPHGKSRGHKGISGISLTDNPELASRYLDRYGEIDYKGDPFSKQMMKVLIRPGEIEGFDAPIPSQYTLGAPLPEGYAWPSALENVDTAIFPDAVPRTGAIRHLEPGTQNAIEGLEYILRDPTRVRSFTAAFDPKYFGDPDLMKARGGLAVKPRKYAVKKKRK